MLFIEECEIHLNPPLTKVWARRGKPARVPAAGDEKKAAVFGAWSFGTDRLSSRISENKNSEEFLAFLSQLLVEQNSERTLILVMDNAGYHRANRVKDFLEQHEDRLEAFWLPPYSPELNLIEYLWGYLKENVTNDYFFGELPRLIEAAEEACGRLSSPADKILGVNFKTGKHFSHAA